MNQHSNQMSHPTPETLMIQRWYAAPPALLWRFWTDPTHIVRWFGPYGAAERSAEVDLRVGGAWGIDFEAFGGVRQVRGVYTELDEPNRLASTWAWLEPDGSKGVESRYVVELVDEGDGALLTLTHTLPTAELAERHGVGWGGSLDALAEALRS